MRSYRKLLAIQVAQPMAFVNITSQVESCLSQSGINSGLVLVHAMHITASVFLHVDEIRLCQDYHAWLEDLAPHDPINRYRHNLISGDANADAHLKRQIMGTSVTLAVTDGKLDFGPWEQIFYTELDGVHGEHVLVKIIGD